MTASDFWEPLALVKCLRLGREMGFFFWCTVAATPPGGGGELEGPRSVSALPRVPRCNLCRGWGGGGRGPSAPQRTEASGTFVSGDRWPLKACAVLPGCATPLGWALTHLPCSTPAHAHSPISTRLYCCCSGSPRAAPANYARHKAASIERRIFPCRNI